jgi:hypothetical protein
LGCYAHSFFHQGRKDRLGKPEPALVFDRYYF